MLHHLHVVRDGVAVLLQKGLLFLVNGNDGGIFLFIHQVRNDEIVIFRVLVPNGAPRCVCFVGLFRPA